MGHVVVNDDDLFEMKICLNCRAEEEDSRTYAYKVCDGKSFEYKYSDLHPFKPPQFEGKPVGPQPPIQWAEPPPTTVFKKSAIRNSARIAIDSANIVNSYGSVLQIVGIIVGIFWIILGIIASKEDG